MQFKVPQNIDQEDKILGPLTFVQFIYALLGGGLLLLMFSVFDFSLFLALGIPVALLTIAFTLVKIQGQPFSHFFVAFLIYLKQPKRRVWQDQKAEAANNQPIAPDFMKASENKPIPPPPATTTPTVPTAPVKPARKVPVTVN